MQQISIYLICIFLYNCMFTYFYIYATLPNFFISSQSLIESLVFSVCNIMLFANSDSFTSSYHVLMPFVLFLFELAVLC